MNFLSLTLPSSLSSDKSVQILNDITGVVYNFIDPSASPEAVQTTFSQLLRHFNEALLGFSLIIFAVMLFVGTMNTASEGQFLGRNWNGVWTPVRLILGILFVVPLKTGLCIGQYLFLYVILLGITIATYVWDHIVSDIFSNNVPPAIPSYVDNYASQMVQKQLVYASIVPIATAMMQNAPQGGMCTRYDSSPSKAADITLLNLFYNKLVSTYDVELKNGYLNNKSPAEAAAAVAISYAIKVGSPPVQLVDNWDPEYHPDGNPNVNPDLQFLDNPRYDFYYFSSYIAKAAYENFKTAVEAHPSRSITLDDINDPCLGADQTNDDGFKPAPAPTSDLFEVKSKINQTYYLGSSEAPLPPELQNVINKNIDVCDGMTRAGDPGAVYAETYSCKRALTNVLSSGAQNGIAQDGYASFGGQYTVWIGNNPPGSHDGCAPPLIKNSGVSGCGYPLDPQKSTWEKPNGAITVTGEYTYSFRPAPTVSGSSDNTQGNSDPTKKAEAQISSDYRSQMNNSLNKFISAYVTKTGPIVDPDPSLNDDSMYKNLCDEDAAGGSGVPAHCSLAALSSALIAKAEDSIQTTVNSQASPSLDSYAVKTMPEYMDKTQLDAAIAAADKNGTHVYYEKAQSCVKKISGDTITEDCKPLFSQTPDRLNPLMFKSELLYLVQREIKVPLKYSWWNAGASYLIVDNQFAENIKLLIAAIASTANSLIFYGNATGSAEAKMTLMVEERPPIYIGDTEVLHLCHPSGDLQLCYPASIVGMDETAMIYGPKTVSIPLTNVNPADFGISDQYASLIQPYNPNVSPSSGDSQNDMYRFRVNNTSRTLFAALSSVPPDYQDPLARLLLYALAESNNNNPACPMSYPSGSSVTTAKHNCFQNLTPYLSNLVNIMAANNVIGATRATLPLNVAMDDMFTKMIGNTYSGNSDPATQWGSANTQMGRGTSISTAASQEQSAGIMTILNDIYNFGYTDPDLTSVAAQQFSLIQQVRNTGISILVNCINSMEITFSHYQGAMQGLVNTVNAEAHGSMAQGAIGTAAASSALFIGAGGVALASAPDITGTGMRIATGIGFAAQSASAMSQILQTQVELAIATTTITTMSNIGIQLMWLPLFLFIITTLITIGVQFAFVIPFMPYIMFWAGQMAWIIGVIEALVAAPLVMLAFAHPGGNDYMGHAQPAVRFLLGVVFRPVLMVIGMLTGILLTYVLIHYSAEGFHIIANNTFNSLPNNHTLLGVISCLLVFMYASFLVMAFTKCFSPIYVLPEKVVQWINGQADRAGEQEAQQFGQQAQQTAQSGAQAGGQAMQQGIDAQKQRGQGMSDLNKQQSSANTQAAAKGGEAFGNTGKELMKFKMSQASKS